MSIEELAKRLGIPEEYLLKYFTVEELLTMEPLEVKRRLMEKVDAEWGKAQKKRRLALSMQDCGLLQAWKRTPSIDLTEKLRKGVESFLSEGKAFFVLYGDVGTYKTRWLLKIAQELYFKFLNLERDIYPNSERLYYLSWSDFVAGTYLKEERAKEAFSRALGAEYLFLDDFLSGQVSDYYYSLAFLLISERYTSSKKTFITTNLDFTELRKSLKEQNDLLRLTDRLVDKNLSVLFRVDLKSMRFDTSETRTFTDNLKTLAGL